MSRVVVLGSSNTDIVLRGDKLPRRGETILSSEYLQAHGGKGANQAVAAARSGAKVTFIGAVGNDAFGLAARSQYESEGLDLSHFRVIMGAPSGVALILVDERGDNMIAVHSGANHCVTPADIAAIPDSVFEPPGVFVVQLETPLDTVAAALERARKAGMITILNPAPMQGMIVCSPLLKLVDIFIPNEPEASHFMAQPVVGKRKGREATLRIAEQTGGHVILTMGDNGCLWQQPGGEAAKHFRAVNVAAVDTVAAGDGFIGALAARLAYEGATPETLGSHIPSAIIWATHAAAISVTRHGAQPSLARATEIETSLRAVSPD